MHASHPDGWKEIAWNGIYFQAPARWEVTKMGTRYLMLETRARPAMELKWARIRGNFSHRKHLERLAASHKKGLRLTLKEHPLPPAWDAALDRFQAVAFSWEGAALSGDGVVVYCPECRTATLIQFYRPPDSLRAEIPTNVLTSFRDHPRGTRVLWSLFDIRASLPAEFALTRYRFETGRFELEFALNHQSLSLKRWGPASILLAETSLMQFLSDLKQIPEIRPPSQITADNQAIEGLVLPSRSWRPAVFSRLRPKDAYQMFRFWHLMKENRILGMHWKGRTPLDPNQFKQLYAGYESL